MVQVLSCRAHILTCLYNIATTAKLVRAELKIDNALQVVRSMITPRRLSRMAGAKLSMAEALQWLCRAEPTSKDLLEALQTWTAKTPAQVALTQVTHMLLTTTLI